MRRTAVFPVEEPALWKKRLLHWASTFSHGVYLDSNGHPGTQWECLVGAGAYDVLEAGAGTAFAQLEVFQKKRDWLFGFFSYDVKNEVEALYSAHFDGIGLPDLGFFQPETVLALHEGRLQIECLTQSPETVFETIKNYPILNTPAAQPVALQPRIQPENYLQIVEKIRQHIAGGDLYEMNFCQEFYAEGAGLDPLAVFERLNQIGRAPFATFMRWENRYLLSASPERFLKKTGRTLTSQPIKGTRRRGQTSEEDENIRRELANSPKDRSENVMIVDLVRNDLSRNCLPGTVQVDELCGIYTFPTVHQMISTVSGQLPDNANALHALRDAFPMGSMTGAPKVMALELIERYEQTRRGLYSGAFGYFSPEGDFDFNVVIRSILYNRDTGYVSASVGGAIVFDSIPEEEYQECLVKVEAMRRALADV
jgi:para-aminobenzoate synthetase component 1